MAALGDHSSHLWHIYVL